MSYGAGDGNRTRTLFEFATIYVGQSVICMLPLCSKQMTWRFRGPIAAFSRLNGLPGTAPNYKFNADKTTNRIATGNNRNNQGKSCPEVDQTSQYKRVYRYQSVGLTYGLPVFPPESVKASGEQLPRSPVSRELDFATRAGGKFIVSRAGEALRCTSEKSKSEIPAENPWG